jgi:hypothetical protein
MPEIASATFFHSASPAAIRDDETATNNVATPMRRRRDVFISSRLPGGNRPKQE